MTQLEDLIHSLITVIIRYHDSQGGVAKLIHDEDSEQIRKKSRKLASDILHNKELDLKEHLTDYIKEATHTYTGRSRFLYFILHEISFLNAIHSRTTSLNPKEFKECYGLIKQLFIDSKKLLSSAKGTTCSVTRSYFSHEEPLSYELKENLAGLKDNLKKYCASGQIFKEEVFDRFNLTHCSEEELGSIALNLCTEHQNALLIPEYKSNYEAMLKQSNEHKSSYEKLNNQLIQTQVKVTENVTKIDQYKQVISQKSTQYKSRVSELEAEIKRLSEQSAKDKQRIEELESLQPTHNSSSTIEAPKSSAPSELESITANPVYFFSSNRGNHARENYMPYISIGDLIDNDDAYDDSYDYKRE